MYATNILIRKTFERRNYTEDFLYEIENPSYDQLIDIDTLAVELKDIHDRGDKLVVYPDFDMDGVAAGSCGFAGFAELGFNVGLYIPEPKDGYGIKPSSIDDVIRQHPDVKCIITCDTGIDCDAAVRYAKERGIRFFITDHHKQKSTNTQADVIVNPMRMDETYSHPAISGSFVMYQVLQSYADLYCNSFVCDQIRRLRVFAGFGTVSDTMPLLYENRQLVRDAVDICRLVYGDGSNRSVSTVPGCDVYRRAFWGIYDLLKVHEDNGTIKDKDDINESFFGYYLAPAVNAVKRMEGDMVRAFSVFFGNNRTDDVMYLYDLNTARKRAVVEAINKIKSSDQPFAPYIYHIDANPGIVGLVAQQLELSSGVPTLVLTHDKDTGHYHGSGRSPEWYPCIAKLSNMMFIAGHECAFGCGADTVDQLKSVYDFLCNDVPSARDSADIAEVEADYIISTDRSGDVGLDIDVFDEYLTQIDNYRPFGKGFPMPVGKLVFCNNDIIDVDIKKNKSGVELFGGAKQHLKIHLPNGFDVICWNQGYLVKQFDAFDTHSVIGSLEYSEYRGVTSIIFNGQLVEQ